MSTILDALQKQKFQHSEHFSQVAAGGKGLLKWRLALLMALLIIICLLTILLYQQFVVQHKGVNSKPLAIQNKNSVLQKTSDFSADGRAVDSIQIESQALNERAIKATQKESSPEVDQGRKFDQRASGVVKKVTFATQPLPVLQGERETVLTADYTVPADLNKPLIETGAEVDFVNDGQEQLDYGAVSDDLRQRFELALLSATGKEEISTPAISNDGRDIYEMATEFQRKVPSIIYDTHIYSTIARERWIRINGEKLKEGQFDGQGQIQLLEIQQNRSIFRFGRQSFSLESLTDWKGY